MRSAECEAGGAKQGAQHAREQPRHDHQHDDGLGHAGEQRLAIAIAVAGERDAGRNGRQQHGPEAAFIGRAHEREPAHATEKDDEGRQGTGDTPRASREPSPASAL